MIGCPNDECRAGLRRDIDRHQAWITDVERESRQRDDGNLKIIQDHANETHRREWEEFKRAHAQDHETMTQAQGHLTQRQEETEECLRDHILAAKVAAAGETRNLKVLIAVLAAAGTVVQIVLKYLG